MPGNFDARTTVEDIGTTTTGDSAGHTAHHIHRHTQERDDDIREVKQRNVAAAVIDEEGPRPGKDWIRHAH